MRNKVSESVTLKLWLGLEPLCVCVSVLSLFVYSFMAALTLSCCTGTFSNCSEWGSSSFARGVSCCRAWAVGGMGFGNVAHRLSCPVACGIFLDQGSHPGRPHWQVGSQSLDHWGSPNQWSYKWDHTPGSGLNEAHILNVSWQEEFSEGKSDKKWIYLEKHTAQTVWVISEGRDPEIWHN